MSEFARQLTLNQELANLPDNVVGEILNGELVVSPRPAALHALAASVLGSELGGPFHRGKHGPGGWVILDEPELHLLDDVVVPDMASWRRERMPELPEVAAFTLAPDWVCEVLSPSTEGIDRAIKMPLFAREKIAYVWLVGCLSQTIETYQSDGSSYRLLHTHHGSDAARLIPFDAIELDIAGLWQR
ncbi:MAG: Uma2 family endonuclease [Kofleriaceae bacterium]|nr:Uma2 family endonuclease [Kofleriaceae bacterium]